MGLTHYLARAIISLVARDSRPTISPTEVLEILFRFSSATIMVDFLLKNSE